MSSTDAASVTTLYRIAPADLECARHFGELLVPDLRTYIELSRSRGSSASTSCKWVARGSCVKTWRR